LHRPGRLRRLPGWPGLREAGHQLHRPQRQGRAHLHGGRRRL